MELAYNCIKNNDIKKFNEELKKYPNSKYARRLLSEDKEVTMDRLKEFKEDWERKKNFIDTFSDLNSVSLLLEKQEVNFDDLNSNIKQKILLAICKGEKYSDNKIINKQLEVVLQKLNLPEINKENLNELIYSTFGIRISNDKEFEKFVSSHEMNSDTAATKFKRIERNLREKENIGKNYYQNTNTFSERNMYQSLEEKEVFNILYGSNDDKKDKALEIINLYKMYYNEGEKSADFKDYVSEYIMHNREYFIEYFQNMGEEGIFDVDGSVSIKKISGILERNLLPESVKENTTSMKEAIENKRHELERIRKDCKDFLDELSVIDKDGTTEKNEDKILDILGKINLKALDNNLIQKLRAYNSPKIDKILNKELDISRSFNKLLPPNMESMTKEDALKDNILLLEAKLEYSRGTADYENNLTMMQSYIKSHPDSVKDFKGFRRENGELTSKGEKEIDGYVNHLLNETIKYNIMQTDIEALSGEDKKIFAAILIAGIESDDLEIKMEAIKKFKKLVPTSINIDDYDELRKKMYGLVYAHEKNDSDEMETKGKLIRKNLIEKILKEKKLPDPNRFKIKDTETDRFFERTAVTLEVKTTDFTKSDINNRFNGSQIEFSEENDRTFRELYCDTTVDSWISDKKDVTKYEIVYIKKAKEAILNNKYGINYRTLEVYDRRLCKLLNNNPDLKEKFENNPEFVSKATEEAERFGNNKIVSDLLENFQNDILAKAEDYNSLANSEKKNIIRYAIFANKFAENIADSSYKEMLQKLGDRTLELMGSEQKNFISFDENGKRTINEKNLLDEINSVFNFKNQCTSYEEAREVVYKNMRFIIFLLNYLILVD